MQTLCPQSFITERVCKTILRTDLQTESESTAAEKIWGLKLQKPLKVRFNQPELKLWISGLRKVCLKKTKDQKSANSLMNMELGIITIKIQT